MKGFLLLCALGYAMSHPQNPGGSALRLAWCLTPLAATVHLAVAGPRDGEVEHRHVRLPGDRKRVRRFATQIILEMLRRRLIAEGSGRA